MKYKIAPVGSVPDFLSRETGSSVELRPEGLTDDEFNADLALDHFYYYDCVDAALASNKNMFAEWHYHTKPEMRVLLAVGAVPAKFTFRTFGGLLLEITLDLPGTCLTIGSGILHKFEGDGVFARYKQLIPGEESLDNDEHWTPNFINSDRIPTSEFVCGYGLPWRVSGDALDLVPENGSLYDPRLVQVSLDYVELLESLSISHES